MDVWERINLVNLVKNVAPTRERAQVVMQKGRSTGCRRFGCAGYKAGEWNQQETGADAPVFCFLVLVAAVNLIVVEAAAGKIVREQLQSGGGTGLAPPAVAGCA